ncbi:hypothetical protein F5I97DRAFT_1863689 [Phlebopus sp. FC_14]|nr:hypothetical protein F5I97DRAFT_1863689 [Phlebopus sp. FC_14]
MSSIYVSLGVTPRKKRQLVTSDDESTYTPKKLRNVPPTPPQSARTSKRPTPFILPPHISRLITIQTALQHALSHALATCAVSPSDTGIVRNVLNHISIATYSGLTTKFDVDDLKRLCWVWEWNGKTITDAKGKVRTEDENPFLDSPATSKDWTRGSMGFVISPTSHYSKSAGKRVPVYGLGIEVEVNIDQDKAGGMAAVARWTADADKRRAEFRSKLESWVKLHSDVTPIPNIPFADIPEIVNATKASSLTRALASASPKGAAILENMIPSTSISPSKSPIKSPVKRASATREFAVPFPLTKPQSEGVAISKNTSSFPHTPSSREKRADPLVKLFTPQTPARKQPESEESGALPVTPVHQRGTNAETAPATPSTSRRQALYDRVKLKSLTSSPSKAQSVGGKLTRDQIQKMGQEEIRRRCLLGRLGGVAESIWMLFSSPAGSTSTPTTRKRKAVPASDVAAAIVKSSPVPMSALEASESLKLLTGLCPFFIKPLDVGGEEWLEMPSTVSTSESREASSRRGSPTKSSEDMAVPPLSPCSKLFGGAVTLSPSPGPCFDSAVMLTRSPRRVKREIGGLREVREIIRRELELQD